MIKNDQIYILMCLLSEIIQKNWKPAEGDHYYSRSDEKVYTATGQIAKKGKYWLPTEFQLSKLAVKYGLLNWIKFDKECAEFWDYFTNLNKDHPTKKMCGIAAIMRLSDNKYWIDNEWRKL